MSSSYKQRLMFPPVAFQLRRRQLQLLLFLLFLTHRLAALTPWHTRPTSTSTFALNELHAALLPLAACPPPLLLRPSLLGSMACVLPNHSIDSNSPSPNQHLCEYAGRILVIGSDQFSASFHSTTYHPPLPPSF